MPIRAHGRDTMLATNMTRTSSKDLWDKCAVLAQVLASVAVPVVILCVGNSYNANIKESENRVRYVELAIAQLRSAPTPETEALRNWALDLLDSQAPIKLPPAARAQLKSNALQLSATAPGATLSITGSGSGGGAVASSPNP